MNRPEGVTKSAWLAAEQALSTTVWFDGDESPLHEAVARAIQSAVEAERERCARIVDAAEIIPGLAAEIRRGPRS